MELLVRWVCPCKFPEACFFCNGEGYFERWMTADLLTHVKDCAHVILCCRELQQAEPHDEVLLSGFPVARAASFN